MGGGCGGSFTEKNEETKKTAAQIADDYIRAAERQERIRKAIAFCMMASLEVIIFVFVFLFVWRLLFQNENIYYGG